MSNPRNRIFIVEDDPDFGFYIEELIRGSGLGRPRLINDGLKALQACLEDPPDLIVLDLDLPSLRGEELCRMLRSSPSHRDIPILVCSEMPQAQRKEMEMLKIGANRYVEKPFVEEGFLAGIEALLSESNGGGPEAAAAPPAPGADPSGPANPPEELMEEFEGYRLQHVVGAGGMGTVYKAKQIKLDREVALKVFLRTARHSPEVVERFRREALIMAKLNHPNIVTIYDAGNTGYTCYIAMEYVGGGSLQDLAARGGPDWERTLRVVNDVFEALSYLHGHKLYHRDIKPANILIAANGACKLGDFGISQSQLHCGSDKRLTEQNVVLGTAMFMAPELRFGLPANELTEQFALGRTLLNMFERGAANFPRKPLHEIRPELPRALSAALERMMELDPEKRFPALEDARHAILSACARPWLGSD